MEWGCGCGDAGGYHQITITTPCQSGTLSLAHKHQQSICQEFQQTPGRNVRRCACRIVDDEDERGECLNEVKYSQLALCGIHDEDEEQRGIVPGHGGGGDGVQLVEC